MDAGRDSAHSDSESHDDSQVLCGNGTIEGDEDCDGSDLGGQTCRSIGFDSGRLSCGADCHFVTNGCIKDCGNGSVDPGEECDGTNVNGTTCQDLGLEPGLLACRHDCTFDLSGCPGCGNGIAEDSEMCDGTDFKGIDCSGGLTCTADCLVDASACHMTTTGQGGDGDLVVSGFLDLSQTDAPSYAVVTIGVLDLFVAEPATGLAVGDHIMLTNLQGCPSACDTVGQWELNMVASVDATRIGLANPVGSVFGQNGSNTDLSCQHIVVLRVPSYRSIEVQNGGTLTTAPWDGIKGGLLVLQVSEQVIIDGGGRISLDGLGFRGGQGRNGNILTGWPGESLCGPAAQESTNANVGAGGGGAVGGSSQDICGQGGGGGGFGLPGQAPDFTTTCRDRGNDHPANNAGLPYGRPDLSLVLLGSGGGGGATDEHSSTSGSGGRGGGTLFLMARALVVAGSLSADGTDGSAGSDTRDSGNGGGGSGGALYLHVGSIDGSGTITARGGLGLPAQDQNWNSPGGDGGPGRIRLDFQRAGGALYRSEQAVTWIEGHFDPVPEWTTISLQ